MVDLSLGPGQPCRSASDNRLMVQEPLNNHESPHKMRMESIAQSVRNSNRPKCIGEPPSPNAFRAAYVFAQTIRSDAERNGIPSHLLSHLLITIFGEPKIPKPKEMLQILATTKAYIRSAEATHGARAITLVTGQGGEITLAKSESFRHGFNFQFMPKNSDAEPCDAPKSPVSREFQT